MEDQYEQEVMFKLGEFDNIAAELVRLRAELAKCEIDAALHDRMKAVLWPFAEASWVALYGAPSFSYVAFMAAVDLAKEIQRAESTNGRV